MERIEKVNQLMKREISIILQQEFQDPKLMFVTVISVDVSRDLRSAVVYYSFLGDDQRGQAIAKTLDQLSSYIRKLIGQRVRLRYTPQFRFVVDKSIEYGARIEKTFREIHEQSEEDEVPET